MRCGYEPQSTLAASDVFLKAAYRGDIAELTRLGFSRENLEQKDGRGYTALMLAAYQGHLEATRYLIARGADVNATDAEGHSILMGVACQGNREILQVLLEAKANPEHRNFAGQDALQLARKFGRMDCMPLLRSGPKRLRVFQLLRALFAYKKPAKRPGRSLKAGKIYP